jgi:hypothetical protein
VGILFTLKLIYCLLIFFEYLLASEVSVPNQVAVHLGRAAVFLLLMVGDTKHEGGLVCYVMKLVLSFMKMSTHLLNR